LTFKVFSVIINQISKEGKTMAFDSITYKVRNRKLLKEKAKIMALLEKSEARRHDIKNSPLTDVERKKLDFGDYLMGATVGFIGGLLGLIKGKFDVKELTNQAYAEHGDEINQKQAEEMDKIIAQLSQYPLDLSNVNANNISEVLEEAYKNCYVEITSSFGNFEIIIKDGWNSYFVDYQNGLGDSVSHQLASVMNNYVDSTTVAAVLVGNALVSDFAVTGIVLGTLYTKNKYNEFKADNLNKEIHRLEILEKCQEDTNGDKKVIEQNIEKELGLSPLKA